MAEEADIEIGARVRARERDVGSVESVEGPPIGPSAEPGYLIVRAADGGGRYRLPRSLVRRVRRREGRATVYLDLPVEQLARFREGRPAGDAAGPTAAPGAETWDPRSSADTLRIPLAAEELTARTQPFTMGTVQLHKGVETIQQRVTVPVQHEELAIERIPADQFDPDAPRDSEEMIIPVMEERLVVQKQTVVREYIRVRRQQVATPQEIEATLRREYLDVSQRYPDGTPAGPALHYAADQDTPAATGDSATHAP